MKVVFLAGAGVLALALGACDGGGSATSRAPANPPASISAAGQTGQPAAAAQTAAVDPRDVPAPVASDGKPIWAANRKHTAQENADYQFGKNGKDFGAVSEADKCDIVRDATISISPSALESFSLVVLEAWEQSVPVIVNATCDPTREHCERSGGGLWFGSYREFEAVLERMTGDAELRTLLGGRGHAYVERYYQWPDLIRRYAAFLTAVRRRHDAACA